jgi:hypothetical protein
MERNDIMNYKRNKNFYGKEWKKMMDQRKGQDFGRKERDV